MLQFALNPLSSVLLCCTTLTDFVLFILKCKMPFVSINILDLFVRGSPCVSCFPYFVSVPKWTLHVLGQFMFVFADCKQYILHWWHMQSSASCRTSLSWFGDLQYLFPRGEFLIFWLSLFIQATEGVRAYPWISTKYMCESVSPSVPMQIMLGVLCIILPVRWILDYCWKFC